jgi:hypothetical protein
MTIRDKVTTEGGNRGYRMMRSKISKDDHGYGKVVSVAREKLMQKLGKDPGYNVVAAHEKPGSHFEKDGGDIDMATRAENTAESNKSRKFKEKLRRMK